MSLAVAHADDWLIVVDKPSGMPSVPARTDRDPPSVVERLRTGGGDGAFFEAAHRLDRDTSGLLVVARSPESRRRLADSFERGRVGKRYLAVVEGVPPGDEGAIHLPLARDVDSPPRQRVDPVLGVRAVTRWRRIATARLAGRAMSLVAVEPVTGRSHQLRVHLAWIGTPIVGDPLYGPVSRSRHGREGLSQGGRGDDGRRGEARLMLHAVEIEFPHPRDGTTMLVRSSADFIPAGWFEAPPAASPNVRPSASTGRSG